MHEVRVYDNTGALKKVIPAKTLKERSLNQILFPFDYGRSNKKATPAAPAAAKSQKIKSA